MSLNLDFDELKRTLAAVAVVGKLDGHDVVRLSSVLELAADRLRRLEAEVLVLRNALWKACGDDEEAVNGAIESQR